MVCREMTEREFDSKKIKMSGIYREDLYGKGSSSPGLASSGLVVG